MAFQQPLLRICNIYTHIHIHTQNKKQTRIEDGPGLYAASEATGHVTMQTTAHMMQGGRLAKNIPGDGRANTHICMEMYIYA